MVEKVVVINTGMVGILQTSNGAGPVVEAMLDSRLVNKLKKALVKVGIVDVDVVTGEVEELSKFASDPKILIAINKQVLQTSSPKIDQTTITNLVTCSNGEVSDLVTKIEQKIKLN
ncbi:hypothetical protein [Pediococcus pentosaceus]|uniref:hypothetical protein n=1 Tax=Pediococcus pentosaceus TaxID=1255 RepID=UPI0018A183F2|nr:hypothetical protein [Pediococcus pentosaceus]MBF7123468.1 hypothetical protein [Pediococcus pentosaceus]MCR1861489.1 hypothetical protein [Pediococcus pentosaceus]